MSPPVPDPGRSRPSSDDPGDDDPTRTSPVDDLLTPAQGAGGGEATQGLPVHLHTLADGRYVLGRQLGAGGMGVVRTAHDELLHREVAVKLLADNLAADPEARERFLREARAAARIQDPHVVAVHDVGDEAGRPYLVMELVDGPSLADVLARDGALDPHEVVEVAAQALAGISRAHHVGLLHRDVKPGNLLCHPDGTIKVTDFGVAEAADTPGLTRTGFVIGTRSYLAPERRRGQPADARTDLYALGATLVELLTGAPPSDDDPPYELPDDIPGGLADLVSRLLAEDPTDRPADAEGALEVLAGNRSTTAEEAAEAIDDAAVISTTALAEGRTEVLPVRAPAGRAARAAGAGRSAPDEGSGSDAAEVPGREGPVVPWRTVVVIGVALLAVVIILQLTTGGQDDPTDATVGDQVDEVEPVERVEDDPEATARNLAEWIREQGAQD